MGNLNSNSMKHFLLSENVCIELSVLLKDKHGTCLIIIEIGLVMWFSNCCYSFTFQKNLSVRKSHPKFTMEIDCCFSFMKKGDGAESC